MANWRDLRGGDVCRNPEIPAPSWRLCPAKSLDGYGIGRSVLRHSLETAAVFKKLLTHLPVSVRALVPEGVLLCPLSHDVGKISPGFLNKHPFREWLHTAAPGVPPDGFTSDHAEISEAALKAHLADGELYAAICGAHHGRREKEPLAADSSLYGGKSWAGERELFLKHVSALSGVPKERLTADQASLIAGLLCVADWIASDEKLFPDASAGDDPDLLEESAAKALELCGWRNPSFRKGLSFADLFGREPYGAQSVFSELASKPGLYILEAPMGCGKTEAALYAAYKTISAGLNKGLYFALPTKATSDRMHLRVQDFLDKACETPDAVSLIHGGAWLNRGGGEELSNGEAWSLPSKRALLAPFGVGTIDQALLGALNVKHSFVRLAALAGKVVVFDEVHSYDLYTGGLLDSLIDSLLALKATVIVLSATLTAKRRSELLKRGEELAAYPAAFSDDGAALSPPTAKAVLLQFVYR